MSCRESVISVVAGPSHFAKTAILEVSKASPFIPLDSPSVFQSFAMEDADHDWRTQRAGHVL